MHRCAPYVIRPLGSSPTRSPFTTGLRCSPGSAARRHALLAGPEIVAMAAPYWHAVPPTARRARADAIRIPIAALVSGVASGDVAQLARSVDRAQGGTPHRALPDRFQRPLSRLARPAVSLRLAWRHHTGASLTLADVPCRRGQLWHRRATRLHAALSLATVCPSQRRRPRVLKLPRTRRKQWLRRRVGPWRLLVSGREGETAR
mmetsp:Transcript_49454/g.160262  ORF Transcript_49454/g.160262 Transcript_49454/m.160262 type:complete len:204 (+) Transcript_49454:320-931(+)